MKNYTEAIAVLNGRKSRKIANNTYLIISDDGNSIAVRLHDTDVVTYYNDGNTKLRTGGWHSNTTKDRMNSYSLVWISQRKGAWFHSNGEPFVDGDTITANGEIVHPNF